MGVMLKLCPSISIMREQIHFFETNLRVELTTLHFLKIEEWQEIYNSSLEPLGVPENKKVLKKKEKKNPQWWGYVRETQELPMTTAGTIWTKKIKEAVLG